MCVCVCVRSWVLLLSSLGASVAILGIMVASWAQFWVLWGCLGHHFGGSGGPLGSILEARGGPWASFWGLCGSCGCLWGSLGAPLAAQGAQGQILPIFSLPFWGHFGYISDVKTVPKSDVIFD